MKKGQSQLFDSIEASLSLKPTFLIKLDARNAFITSQYAKFRSIKIGLNHGDVFKYGIGYSWMKNDHFTIQNFDSLNLRVHYLLGFLDYTFYSTKHWQFSIPIQLGVGMMRYKEIEGKNAIERTSFMVYEPAMAFDYLFLRYFSIGLGFGYRLGIKFSNIIEEKLSSPIYLFRLRINFKLFYKDNLTP